MIRPCVALSLLLLVGVGASGAETGGGDSTMTLRILELDSGSASPWMVVNDGVMGGISEGGLDLQEPGFARFAGRLSLANNGGFASVRARLEPRDLSAFAGLELRVRGDGRDYQLRLRTDTAFDGPAYTATFSCGPSWETVRIPFSRFEASFRGRPVPSAPPLDPSAIRQLGLLIADKKEGAFQLDLKWIDAYRDDDPPR